MSRLRNRLEGAFGPTRPHPGESSATPTGSDALRRRLDRILGPGQVVAGSDLPPRPPAPQAPPPQPIDRVVKGTRVSHPDGGTFRARWQLPADHRHGQVSVAQVAAQILDGARELFPDALGGVDRLDQLAFLDTETTGLSLGAGTVPFLVGLGRWRNASEPAGFEVVQLFLEELDHEAALLQVLARELDGVRCLVTYNGRNYDLPLLRNRYVLQRLPWPLGDVPHLDLLYPARSLWKAQHANCRLLTLEHSLLGFTRHGDIPGAEIPPLYRDYLVRGADTRMAAVFHHNRDDIVSLAGLLGAAGHSSRQPRGRSALGVGLLHARNGRGGAARAALQAGLEGELPPGTRWRALKELSLAHKRDGDWPAALATWATMRQLDPGAPLPWIESAKVLEHRLKDPAGALRLVEEALGSGPWTPGDRRELERRRDRLRRKMGTRSPRAR